MSCADAEGGGGSQLCPFDITGSRYGLLALFIESGSDSGLYCPEVAGDGAKDLKGTNKPQSKHFMYEKTHVKGEAGIGKLSRLVGG